MFVMILGNHDIVYRRIYIDTSTFKINAIELTIYVVF